MLVAAAFGALQYPLFEMRSRLMDNKPLGVSSVKNYSGGCNAILSYCYQGFFGNTFFKTSDVFKFFTLMLPNTGKLEPNPVAVLGVG